LLTGMVLLAGGLAPIASAKKPTPEQPQEARYTLVELVGLGGMGRSADINDDGHIVFNRLRGPSDSWRAFLLTPDETEGEWVWSQDVNGDGINDLQEDLGTLSSGQSRATAVNISDEVVGVSDASNGAAHAFFWDRNNGMIDLGVLGEVDDEASRPYSINDFSQVVGFTTHDAASGHHAFFWEDSNANNRSDPGEMIDLGTLGGMESEASFIHDSGLVLGKADVIGGDTHAFLLVPIYDTSNNPVIWFLDGNSDGINDLMIDLGTFGGTESWACAMNDSGKITGTARNNHDIMRSFLLTPADDNNDLVWFRDSDGDGINDLMADLGTFQSLTGSTSFDLNDVDQVVGQASKLSNAKRPGGKVVRIPFLWEDGQMMVLNDLTDRDISGDGFRINNAGQILTRYSILLPILPAP